MKKKIKTNFLKTALYNRISLLAVLILGHQDSLAPIIIVMLSSLAFYFMGHKYLIRFAFTAWVFVFVAISLFYPNVFGSWFGFDLGHLIVPLIQLIMFGMGTTLLLVRR